MKLVPAVDSGMLSGQWTFLAQISSVEANGRRPNYEIKMVENLLGESGRWVTDLKMADMDGMKWDQKWPIIFGAESELKWMVMDRRGEIDGPNDWK